MTLSKYLEGIAEAVLRPLGYLYTEQGANEGTWGYSGIHSNNSLNKMWDKWECMCILDLSVAIPGQIINLETYGVTCKLWRLYWTAQDGQQGSWWVRDEQDGTS